MFTQMSYKNFKRLTQNQQHLKCLTNVSLLFHMKNFFSLLLHLNLGCPWKAGLHGLEIERFGKFPELDSKINWTK